MLRKLQRNIRALGNEELEMHPISAWKEAKLQFYGGPDGAAMQRRPLIHVHLHISARFFIQFIFLHKQLNSTFKI